MIAAEVFAEKFEVICSRFNRDVDPEEAHRYYDYLTVRMDTAQFERASKVIWAESSRFPKPADFIVHAGPPDPSHLLPSSVPANRDPYWQQVRRVLRASSKGQTYDVMFSRREQNPPSDDDSGSPFFFPHPVIEYVDAESQVGISYVDRNDLRERASR